MKLKSAVIFFIIRPVMHRNDRIFPFLGLLVCWLIASAFLKSHSAVIKTAPKDLFMTPSLDIAKMPEFKKIAEAKDPEPALDNLKMKYLLARVRQSPYTFIRNGETFTGVRAAMHLIWKYQRKADQVKNIHDFIEVIAGESSMSGEPYLMKLPDGSSYRVKEIMENELELLNERLHVTVILRPLDSVQGAKNP